MIGREDQKSNDLFFVCSLIEYIARKTKNKPSYIALKLGRSNLKKIYDLADVYHSDNISAVSDSFIEECGIKSGTFDNVGACEYSIPSHWDIGKVYKRLIKSIAKSENIEIIDALMKAYQSKVSDLIEDYNSSFYYDNPQSIFAAYENGGIPE